MSLLTFLINNVKMERNRQVMSHPISSISECCVCMKFVHILSKDHNLYFLEKFNYNFFFTKNNYQK